MSVRNEIERITNEVSTQEDLISQIASVIENKAAGGNASVETWTFTLEDGSTVTKAVYV